MDRNASTCSDLIKLDSWSRSDNTADDEIWARVPLIFRIKAKKSMKPWLMCDMYFIGIE
jgi:hypothetical protein